MGNIHSSRNDRTRREDHHEHLSREELLRKVSNLEEELMRMTRERDALKDSLEKVPLDTLWRYNEYENREDGLFSQATKEEILNSFNPDQFPNNCRYVNLLVVGLLGSGKSSFVNTAKTVLRDSGEISTIAAAYGQYLDPTTEKLHEVVLKEFEEGNSIRIYDCRGIRANSGIKTEDIKKTIGGFIEKDYKYKTKHQIDEDNPSYRRNPTLEDEIHGVFFIVNAETFEDIEETDMNIFKDLRKTLTSKRIPSRLVLTKMDCLNLCDPEDVGCIFKSRHAWEKVDKAAKAFQMQLNQVFPVSNYVKETDQNLAQDILALKVIKSMLDASFEYLKGR